MRQCVRVVAEYAGDQENPRDPTHTITVDVCLNPDGTVVRQLQFGFANDGGKKYPFTLEPPKGKDGLAQFYWGPSEDGGSRSSTNLLTKRMKIGEFFTRHEHEEGDWPYRIIRVVDLGQET